MITVNSLREFKAKQEKITMLTCYDATFAFLLDHCGVEILLVGDSLGMVIQGHTSTLPVQLQDICYHNMCSSCHQRSFDSGRFTFWQL